MSETKLEKFLAELRRRLQNDPAFHDDLVGSLSVPVFHGALSGTIEINVKNSPGK